MSKKVYAIKNGKKTEYVTIIRCPTSNGVDLVLCDKNGKRLSGGYLICLNSRGYRVQSGVSVDTSFPLDESNGIKIRDF